MKKRRFLGTVVLGIILFSHVSAETIVQYRYDGYNNDQKRIQLVGTLVPDKDIKMTEYNHEITVKKDGYEIPKYTPFEQKLLDLFGFEKLNKLIGASVINLEGSKYRFFDFNNRLIGKYDGIQVEKKEILHTNMNHNRNIMIESDKDQEITFKLYPIPSEYHAVEYARDSLNNQGYKYGLPDKNTLITLYDTTSEYHRVSGTLVNNPLTLSEAYEKVENNGNDFGELNSGIQKLEIKKKYELFIFKRKFPIGLDWESKVILPYYEFTVDVKKGRNSLNLYYSTYQFKGEKIQIR